jgi:hypothetical protein
LGADGHEDRSFDGPVGGVEEAGAGAGGGTFGDDFEGDLRGQEGKNGLSGVDCDGWGEVSENGIGFLLHWRVWRD